MIMKTCRAKPALLQLFQGLGYYHNLLRQVLLYKVKDMYMGGQPEPRASKQGKSKSMRVWLYRLHEKVIFWFLKQETKGFRGQAGTCWICTNPYAQLPIVETTYERGMWSRFRLESGYDPGRHQLASGQKICSIV